MTATGHRFPTKCGCDLRVAYYVLHSTSRMYTVREAFLVGVSQKMPDPRARVVQACTNAGHSSTTAISDPLSAINHLLTYCY